MQLLLWQFGDGNSSTLQHPSHTYANNGTYQVVLIVNDAMVVQIRSFILF
ncbi:MAG: PKD domain-containing protein [Bacteroidetes bacterium]|nr:PKD domain-containing protein [Bacteroidota bacterium]